MKYMIFVLSLIIGANCYAANAKEYYCERATDGRPDLAAADGSTDRGTACKFSKNSLCVMDVACYWLKRPDGTMYSPAEFLAVPDRSQFIKREGVAVCGGKGVKIPDSSAAEFTCPTGDECKGELAVLPMTPEQIDADPNLTVIQAPDTTPNAEAKDKE